MSTYLQQGTLNFAPGYKLQTQWGVTEAGVFTLETTGALMAAVAAQLGPPGAGFVLGLAMVMAAIVLLFVHLGHPARAWRAIIAVRTSWISRGTLALGAFVLCGLIYLALTWGAADAAQARGLTTILMWLLAPIAVFVGLYPGLILSASPAIPFWSSGLLPVLSLLQGGATAAVMLLAFRAQGAIPDAALLWAAIALLAALAVGLLLYLGAMLRRGAAAAESARFLLRGHGGQFIIVACGVGIVLPLILLGVAAQSAAAAQVLAGAAVARLIGDLALRDAFLKVGMFEPVI